MKTILALAIGSLLFATSSLTNRVVDIAHKLDATVGVAALNLETGKRISINGNVHFPMGSVYKVPIAIALLQRVDKGEFSLDKPYTIQPSEFSVGFSPIRDNAKGQPVTLTLHELLDAMVSTSDNTAADYIQKLVGGGARVTKVIRAMGVSGVRVDRTEKAISEDVHGSPDGVERFQDDVRDTATPDGMVALLRKLHLAQEGLSPASHKLLMTTMENSKNPRRLVLQLPTGTIVAHKTGTMARVLNDVGILSTPDRKRNIAIAIFIKRSKVEENAPREAVLAEIARAVWDEL